MNIFKLLESYKPTVHKVEKAVSQSLYQKLSYHSLVRRCLIVDILPTAALPIYDKQRYNDFVYSLKNVKNKTVVHKTDFADHAVLPMVKNNFSFATTYNPFVNNEHLMKTMFDEAFTQSLYLENRLFVRLINRVLKDYPNQISDKYSHADYDTIQQSCIETMIELVKEDLKTAIILVNDEFYHKVLSRYFIGLYEDIGKKKQIIQNFDIVTHKCIIDTGFVGTLFGNSMLINETIPYGYMYFLADPEYVGVFPTYNESISCSLQDGIQANISTHYNMGIFNTKAVRAVKFTRDIIDCE